MIGKRPSRLQKGKFFKSSSRRIPRSRSTKPRSRRNATPPSWMDQEEVAKDLRDVFELGREVSVELNKRIPKINTLLDPHNDEHKLWNTCVEVFRNYAVEIKTILDRPPIKKPQIQILDEIILIAKMMICLVTLQRTMKLTPNEFSQNWPDIDFSKVQNFQRKVKIAPFNFEHAKNHPEDIIDLLGNLILQLGIIFQEETGSLTGPLPQVPHEHQTYIHIMPNYLSDTSHWIRYFQDHPELRASVDLQFALYLHYQKLAILMDYIKFIKEQP